MKQAALKDSARWLFQRSHHQLDPSIEILFARKIVHDWFDSYRREDR